MKKLIITSLLFVCALSMNAQSKTVYLFEQFTTATIKFKNRGVTKVNANYDAGNKRLMYAQGDDLMELTSAANIDTISFGERKFVPYIKGFVEVARVNETDVLIDWSLREVFVGNRGALGAITQANVKPVSLDAFGDKFNDSGSTRIFNQTNYEQQKTNANEVYKRKSDNEYLFKRNGKYVRFKNEKQLIKLFPTRADEIKNIIKTEGLDMKYAEDVIQLLGHLL